MGDVDGDCAGEREREIVCGENAWPTGRGVSVNRGRARVPVLRTRHDARFSVICQLSFVRVGQACRACGPGPPCTAMHHHPPPCPTMHTFDICGAQAGSRSGAKESGSGGQGMIDTKSPRGAVLRGARVERGHGFGSGSQSNLAAPSCVPGLHAGGACMCAAVPALRIACATPISTVTVRA
eukprot:365408-Chlamydomonas_euryale.AAC.25